MACVALARLDCTALPPRLCTAGTPHYMPPEIWKNQPYSYSSDSWAVGCLMYEMMTFRVP